MMENQLEIFVARQPIFDIKKNVYAYELLFRSGLDNYYDTCLDGDNSTAKLIVNSFLLIGLENVTNQKKAFINFTRNLILNRAPSLIPNHLVSVELLEDIEPDENIVNACSELKAKGYEVVLDDFVFSEKYRPLMALADIIKIDFLQTKGIDRKRIVELSGGGPVKFLAEKVETEADFQEALDLGFELFQGYFFSKPIIISGRDIPSVKLNHLRLLSEINRPDVEFEKLEEIIKHDVSLTYKLLRFINSAYFRFSIKVESIKHALVLLGVREVKKWASILAMGVIGEDKPQEVINMSLVRAKFCELIAQEIGKKSVASDFFMMGLFSFIDVMIGRPMSEILGNLYLDENVKNALLGEKNIYAEVFALVVAYESGNWERVGDLSARIGLSEIGLPTYYFSSTKWATMSF